MERIASFNVDHTKLKEGFYVSRTDKFGNTVITTYDLRMKRPNNGDYLSDIGLHTIEHMGATFFRNDACLKDKTVYFGPMGCRTGFYIVLDTTHSSEALFPKVKEMFEFILSYEGTVPGASEKECGNYRELDLNEAKMAATEFLKTAESFDAGNFVYPN